MINKSQQTFLKKKLPLYIKMASSLSLVVGAMGVASHAYAADAKVIVDTTEEVIVTGQRASIESAQDIKKKAEVVIDSITAVDIGALPDRSVAEALQRIPGVSLQRTNENRDPARLAAEGGGVFIRGLSWVRTELNGHDVFSANNGRSLGFEDVSADLMAGVDVYKSPSADLIEGGIGGSVNLRTRNPFDSTKRIIAISADYNYAELLDKGFTSGNALYSDRFDTEVGEVGVLVSVSKGNIGNRTDSVQTARFESYATDAGKQYLPDVLGQRRIDWEQERNSYTGVLQWAPSNELLLTASVIHADATPKDIEHALQVGADGAGNITPTSGKYTYSADGVVQSGVVENATISLDTRYGKRESNTDDYSVSFKYTPDDHWTFSGDAQHIKSTTDVLSMTAFSTLQNADGSFGNSGVWTSFDINKYPHINVSAPDRQTQQSQYYWAAAMDHLEDNSANENASRLDADYAFDNSFLKSFRFGIRATDRNAKTRQTGYNWSLLSAQPWGNGSHNKITLDKAAVNESELFTFNNFFRGEIPVGGVGWFPKESTLTSNTGAYDALKGTISNGWGWSPLTEKSFDTNYAVNGDTNQVSGFGDNVSSGINNQTEQTSAGYAELRFGDDSGNMLGKPFDGNIGIRVVETDTSSIGKSQAGGIGKECLADSSADCAGALAFVTAYNNAESANKTFKNNYTNVLPSFNMRIQLEDDLQLRLGLSQSMVRPDFSKTRPYQLVNFSFQSNAFNPNKPNTLTSGAPALKPTLANNFDASLEWYFAPTGSVTAAVFYKEISDYIMGVTDATQLTYGGKTYSFENTHQVNGAKGTLKGIEIGYQQFFDFLPGAWSGLGIQSNFTYIDNQGGANPVININDSNQLKNANEKMPLEGMSRTNYNLALMYSKYGIDARLAYNWRERYLLTTSAANANRPVWMNDYGQVDGSVFYTVNDNLKVGIQATNITNSTTTMDIGYPSQISPYSWTAGERRAAFVVRAQF